MKSINRGKPNLNLDFGTLWAPRCAISAKIGVSKSRTAKMVRDLTQFLGPGESCPRFVHLCRLVILRQRTKCCIASTRADRPSQLSHEAQEQGQECWRRRRAQEARRYWDSRPARFEKCEDPCCRHWSSGARHTGERHGARAPYSLRPRTWNRATVASMRWHAIAADPRAWPHRCHARRASHECVVVRPRTAHRRIMVCARRARRSPAHGTARLLRACRRTPLQRTPVPGPERIACKR